MAIYEVGGQRYEVPDSVQGAQLEQTLMLLSDQGAQPEAPMQEPMQQAQQRVTSQADRRTIRGRRGSDNGRIADPARNMGGSVDGGLASVLEPAATIATGMIAEPIAGLAGIAGSILPGEEGQGSRFVEQTREALTFQPRTEAGQAGLQSLGEAVQPVGEAFQAAESALGNAAFEATGSPALAAAAQSIPTAIGELIGLKGGKAALRAGRKVADTAADTVTEGRLIREIGEAAPTINQLKTTSREIFKEIDDLGARVNADDYADMAADIEKAVMSRGLDAEVTPKSARALKRITDLVGDDPSLSDIDRARNVAQNAAKSLEPAESALGTQMIQSIDEFLDNANPQTFTRTAGDTTDIGQRYRAARQLWGQARRSETIQEAFEKARLQASGFENGIRVQFRSILNNKRQRRFFNDDELAAMRRVVQGTKGENLAKLVGRLGFSEGGATNIVGGALGATAGGVVGGAPGAVIVPVIGQVSRKLAQRMTAKNAEFADQVIRAGKDARRIARAYLKNTPRNQWDSAELSELLLRPDIDLSDLPKTDIVQDAAKLATQERLAQLGGALAAGQESAFDEDQE